MIFEEQAIQEVFLISPKIIEDNRGVFFRSFCKREFEKITDNKEYILYHLVLENENSKGHYGVYLKNDILSESCSEACFISFFNLTRS